MGRPMVPIWRVGRVYAISQLNSKFGWTYGPRKESTDGPHTGSRPVRRERVRVIRMGWVDLPPLLFRTS